MEASIPTAGVTPQTPRKWSSLLNEEGEMSRNEDLTSELQCEYDGILPSIQPNITRKETTLTPPSPEGSVLLSELKQPVTTTAIDEPFEWNELKGTNCDPVSPLRSPVVADWKIVGSPFSISNDALFDKSKDENISQSTSSNGGMNRRQRAMSLIERVIAKPSNFLSNVEVERYRSVADAAATSNQSSQQLPVSLPIEISNEFRSENDSGSVNDLFIITSPDESSSASSTEPLPSHSDKGTNSNIGIIEQKLKMLFTDSSSSHHKNDEEFNSPSNTFMDNAAASASLFSPWSSNEEFSVDDYLRNKTQSRISLYFTRSSLYFINQLSFRNEKPQFSTRRHSLASFSIPTERSRSQSIDLGDFNLKCLQDWSHEMECSNSSIFAFEPSSPKVHFSSSSSVHGRSQIPSYANHYDFGSSNENLSAKDVSFHLSSYKGPLYAVEFKAGRAEIFYVLEIDGSPQIKVQVGDLVIVEADRGEDLGKVTVEISVEKLKQLMMPNSKAATTSDEDLLSPELAALVHSKEIVPKRIHRLAQTADLKLLQAKAQEEAIAMVRCQSRIRQKKLPMEVVDAEYQWDRNKLTFYFCAERRIDFRELVRDLFRIYKTRIWMCAVDKSSPRMLTYSSCNGKSSCDQEDSYCDSIDDPIMLNCINDN